MKRVCTIARLRLTMLLPVAVLLTMLGSGDAAGQDTTVQAKAIDETPVEEAAEDVTLIEGVLFGQNEVGETIGTVPDALIKLSGEDGSDLGSTKTDDTGFYSLEVSTTGRIGYKVTAEGYEEEDAGRGFTVSGTGLHWKPLFVGVAATTPTPDPDEDREATEDLIMVEGVLFGQNSEGETTETVANAQIELSAEDGSDLGSATTDESGHYSAELSRSGRINYKVTAEGYEEEDDGRGFTVSGFGLHWRPLFVGKGTPDPEMEEVPNPTPAVDDSNPRWKIHDSSNPPENISDPVPEETTLQGYVLAQNEFGETLEEVSGALVQLTGGDGSEAGSARTDDSGYYSIVNLSPGGFDVTITTEKYEDEDEDRGIVLPIPGEHYRDFFLGIEPDEDEEPGELIVNVFEENSDGKFPLDGAAVEALRVEGRDVVAVPTSRVGVHEKQLAAVQWSLGAKKEGFKPQSRQTVTVPSGDRAVCEFVFTRIPPKVVEPTMVLAVVGVERSGEAAGGEPTVLFGTPASAGSGGAPSARRGPPDPTDVLVDRVAATRPLRRLNPADLAKLGRTPDKMPEGQWDWYLANPSKPISAGVVQATSSVKDRGTKTSASKPVRPGRRTILDLLHPLPKIVDDDDDDEEEEVTWLEGTVWGQNDEGETIESLPGTEIQLRTKAGSVVASTTADEDGDYLFDDLWAGDFVYRLRSPDPKYKVENAGRGVTVHTGLNMKDLFLGKDPPEKPEDNPRDEPEDTPEDKPKEEDNPGRLEGYVREILDQGRRPLDHINDGAVVTLTSARTGKPRYLKPDKIGYHNTELAVGSYFINATATGFGSLPKPVKVEITKGQVARRDFNFRKRRKFGKVIGAFWKLTSEQAFIRLPSSDANVELSNIDGDLRHASAPQAQYARQLEEGDWLATPIVPSGYEIVDGYGAGLVNVVAGGPPARRDFVVRRPPLGELVCRVWEVNDDGKFPLTADVMLIGSTNDTIPVSGEYRTKLRTGSLQVGVKPLPNYELIAPKTSYSVMIEGNKTETCEFMFRRRECVSGPSYAIVAVECKLIEGQTFAAPDSEPMVYFMKASAAAESDYVFAGSGSGGEGIPAASIRRLPRNEYDEWGISTDEGGRWAWFLADAGQPLAPGMYFVEGSAQGCGTRNSSPRKVSCDLETIHDLSLPRRQPHVTVIVVDKDNKAIPGTPVNLVSAGKSLSQGIKMTTDAQGRDGRVLKDGIGPYKVLLAPPGYKPVARRDVWLPEDENVLKFRIFKHDQQTFEDLTCVVVGETTMAQNDVVEEQVTEPVEGARIELQAVGDRVIGQEFQEPVFSGSQGQFEFRELPEGTYHVTISKQGYRTLVTQLDVKPGVLNCGPFVLKRRFDAYDTPIACMLTRGWGKSPEAQQAAKFYYQQALTADSTHCAADYAMTLCLLSARQDREARQQVSQAVRKQSNDFVWDRAVEARIWLNMFLGENQTALREIESLTQQQYSDRIENPGNSDTASLMGAAFGVLQGPLQEETASLNVAEQAKTVLASLRTSQRELFEQGQTEVTEQFKKFQSELTEIREQCLTKWKEERETEIARVESRITQIEAEATINTVELETMSVTEIDEEMVEIQGEMQTLVVEWNEKEPVYNQMERQYLQCLAELNNCINRTKKPKKGRGGGGGGGTYQEFYIDEWEWEYDEWEEEEYWEEEEEYWEDDYEGGSGGGGFGALNARGPTIGMVNTSSWILPLIAAQLGQTTTTTGGQGGYGGDPCAALKQRVDALYQEGSQMYTRGVQIKTTYTRLEKRYKLLVRQRSRTITVEKRLEQKVRASKVNIEKAVQLKTELEKSEMAMTCTEVETKKKTMREFHRYQTYPLERRRQELLEWVSRGGSHNCEAAPVTR